MFAVDEFHRLHRLYFRLRLRNDRHALSRTFGADAFADTRLNQHPCAVALHIAAPIAHSILMQGDGFWAES